MGYSMLNGIGVCIGTILNFFISMTERITEWFVLTFYALAAILILLACLLPRPCVKLPNGVIISRDSYFNFSDQYLTPNVLVKGPDKEIFSRGNDGTFYFSKTTAWWVDIVGDGLPLPAQGLAYRPDVGLVRKASDPSLYEKLVREAGPLLEEGRTLRNTNVLGVLLRLVENPRYRTRDCSIPLFTMTKSYP